MSLTLATTWGRSRRTDRPQQHPSDGTDVAPATESERLAVDTGNLTAVGALAVVAVLLLAFGQAPFVVFPRWTLRFAALVLVLPVGSVMLARLAARRDRATIWGLGFLLVATVSAATSSGGARSILGQWGSDATVVIYAAVLALWAIGRSMRQPERNVVGPLIIGALAVNVSFGLVQVVLGLEGGVFNSFPGRASGFLANPVYFASAVSGALGWAAWRTLDERRVLDPVLVSWFAFGVGLTGSRVALFAALAGGLGALVVNRSRRVGIVIAAGGLGLVVAWLLTRQHGHQSTVGRLGQSGSDGRTSIWRYGLEGFGERPLLGWGLGRFKVAVQGRFSPAFVHHYAPSDAAQPWFDPHNIVIMLLTTTGLLGVAAIAGFAWHALRGARGPFRAFAVMAAITWMAQPATVHSFPLAMLALGLAAAAPATETSRTTTERFERLIAPAAVAGAAALIAVVIPSMLMDRAFDRGDTDLADSLAVWFVHDPTVSDSIADLHFGVADRDDDDAAAALRWSRSAIDADPTRPQWWANDALRAIAIGDRERARDDVDEALALQPTSVAALEAQYLLAVVTQDPDAERYKLDLCEVDPDRCDPDR